MSAIKMTRGERVFNAVNLTALFVFVLMILLPVGFVLKKSLDIGARGELNLSLIPKEFSLLYYKMLLADPGIFRPFLNSIYLTVVGTLVAMVVNTMGAYTLSKRDLPGNRLMIYMIVVTMMFSGGLVPLYLVVVNLGLYNRLNTLIFIAMVNGWYMILIRNFYWSIPASLSESALMDGAGDFVIFSRIIIPLSKPVLAAIALFTGVGFWNTFFHAVIFMSDPFKYTLPVKLRELISITTSLTEGQLEMALGAGDPRSQINVEGVSSAIIIVSMVPVIIVYPYLQKHFVKGIMVGSIKG
jgi:putative aldouronate transport system permease protein